jgi:hypothetical protein
VQCAPRSCARSGSSRSAPSTGRHGCGGRAGSRLRDARGHRIKFVLGAGMQNVKSNSETASGRLHAASVCRRVGVGWVDEEGNVVRGGDKFVQ